MIFDEPLSLEVSRDMDLDTEKKIFLGSINFNTAAMRLRGFPEESKLKTLFRIRTEASLKSARSGKEVRSSFIDLPLIKRFV